MKVPEQARSARWEPEWIRSATVFALVRSVWASDAECKGRGLPRKPGRCL